MPYKKLEDKKEYQAKYQKEYREKNRDKLNKLKREWRKNNIEHSRAWHADYARKQRAKYPERFREYDRKQKQRYREKKRKWILDTKLKHGGKCVECGYDEEIRILHFHHPNNNKEAAVSALKNLKAIEKEAAKCILLCPNCHALKHLPKC